LVETSLST